MKSRPESSFPWPAVALSIAAILCILAGALTAQSVVVENTSTSPQAGWVTVPLPTAAPDGPRTGPDVERAEVRAGVLYAQLELAAEERRSIDLVPGGGAQVFTVHPWVLDELDRLWPSFVATRPDGDEFRSTPAWPRLIEAGASRWVFQLDTMIPQIPLVVRAYFYLFANSPIIEFEVRVSYGTIVAGQPVEVPLEGVRMELGERPVVDYASRKGIGAPVRAGETWHQSVSAPRAWFRGRTIELTGAMLCQPAADPYGLSSAAEARLVGPLTGVARGWDGHFLATKRVASARGRPWAIVEQAKRRAAYIEGRTRVGDEMDPRPFGQPPSAGTTGDQADFGAVRCEHVRLDTDQPEPWAIHDLRFSVQAWLLRPYANREASGAPLTKAGHPGCETYNLVPYDRLSHDMLGWPKPAVWITGYGPSDSQHRSDNLLYGLYALTRSLSLRDTILDMLVLQSMEVRREPVQWGGIGSPRGWGRPLLALSHAYSCGFTQAEPIIRQMVADMWVARSYGIYPPDAEIRWLSDNEGKYGWLEASKMIRAGLGWQDATAVLGLYAAWCQLGIPEARQMALDAGDSITRWAFYRDGSGKLLHCYAIRYDPALPGRAPAVEHFTPGQPNLYVYTDGSCSSWAAAALHVVLSLDPGHARAAEMVEAFGPPTGWNQACWWVMR